MTDAPLPDATEPEELASAILDGEATGAEQARADDPDVAEALASFRRVADALGQEPAVDELARERAIAAALGAWGTEAEPAPVVDELARRRQARRGLRVIGAAAAVVAALAVGGLALGGGDRDDSDASSSADVAAEAPAETGGETSAAAVPGDSSTTRALVGLDLGPYDDLDRLVADAAAVATQLANASATGAGGDSSFDQAGETADGTESGSATGGGSAGQVAGDDDASAPDVVPSTEAASACAPPPPPPGGPTTASTATLEGRPVSVLVVGSGDDAVVQVVDAQTCEVVYEGPAG